MKTRTRIIIGSSLALLLAGGILVTVFWRPGKPAAKEISINPAPLPPPVRTVQKGKITAPSGPSAAGLVSALASQVGPAFKESAVSRGSAPLGTFRQMEYPLGKPGYDGEPAVAFVSVPSTGDNVAIEPNQAGEFPPVYADPGETVQVGLVFPATLPGTKVRIVAEDGGELTGAGGKPAFVTELDAGRSFSLPFTLGQAQGSYRLTVATTEGEARRVHLHAGPAMR